MVNNRELMPVNTRQSASCPSGSAAFPALIVLPWIFTSDNSHTCQLLSGKGYTSALVRMYLLFKTGSIRRRSFKLRYARGAFSHGPSGSAVHVALAAFIMRFIQGSMSLLRLLRLPRQGPRLNEFPKLSVALLLFWNCCSSAQPLSQQLALTDSTPNSTLHNYTLNGQTLYTVCPCKDRWQFKLQNGTLLELSGCANPEHDTAVRCTTCTTLTVHKVTESSCMCILSTAFGAIQSSDCTDLLTHWAVHQQGMDTCAVTGALL